ncbi:tobH protein [Nocardia implantans]|uniref:TobH protein n=1 Tax=Nocardia implantans TaxID=3108168 RepID=A0ABU6B218_9NOCA|nr:MULTISPECIES: tobH protein [unclassified Nocardia]MBF6194931.1 tobH protein [Nocardia beijingensis]MEA3530410.1 tobH protein [Nocardia sp. CDC192]MEB3513730.1 tobH protein [Nocardia sp. CDC186]
MIAGTPVLDLDDAASLEAADAGGALRSAASGGAQVRATAAAVGEDALARLADLRPRSVVLVSGSGRAARAAGLLVAALGDRAGLPVVPAAALPPWVGPLDVVLVSGDDAGDPRLIDAVDRALRRGAEVVVAAPHEGPLRAAAAGRAAVLEPRVQVLGYNRLLRFLAAGIAVLRAVDPQRTGAVVPELADLADVLDAEALRDGPHNEVFHNPAKTLAARMQQRGVVLAGDSPAAAELAEHGAEVLLQSAGKVATAVDLAEAVAARTRMAEAAGESAPGYDPLFHDEELDGPAPVERIRVFVLSADRDRAAARRRIAVFGGEAASMVDADLVNADVDLLHTEMTDPAAPAQTHAEEAVPANGTELEQLAVLALRLEMAAAYLRLIGSRTAPADSQEQYGGSY